MRRRSMLLAGGALFVAAQAIAQTGRILRIASVSSGSEGSFKAELFDPIRLRLSELGYIEGRNFTWLIRYAHGDMSRLPALHDELLALQPDAFVTTDFGARLIKSKGSSVPVVLFNSADPVGAGFAQSLARPGGNFTGYAGLQDQFAIKHGQIMKEIIPGLTRAGQWIDQNNPTAQASEANMRQAAQSLGFSVVPYRVANQADIENALARMEKDRIEVLLTSGVSALIFRHLQRIETELMRMRIPSTSWLVTAAEQSALLVYGPDPSESHRVVASYVDKIFKGAKPGDLPIEQPTRFVMVINMKTAKTLGLKIPPAVLLRADRVIE